MHFIPLPSLPLPTFGRILKKEQASGSTKRSALRFEELARRPQGVIGLRSWTNTTKQEANMFVSLALTVFLLVLGPKDALGRPRPNEVIKPLGSGPPLVGDKALAAGDKVIMTNSFTGTPCSISSQCNGLFDAQPKFPGNLACCRSEQPETWTVEMDGDRFTFKSPQGEYLCAIPDKLKGIWGDSQDPNLPEGYYLVTEKVLRKGCSYLVTAMENGEVSLRSDCSANGSYVGLNTAGFRGKNGEYAMCAVWQEVFNTGHTYLLTKGGGQY